jgi:gliding motility-associated-like protein
MKYKLTILIVSFLLTLSGVQAQVGFSTNGGISCGSGDIMNQLYKKDNKYRQLNDQIEQQLLQFKQSGQKTYGTQSIVTLPVVVHIIHNNGPENISDTRVLTGIQHLNEAFANTGFYNPATGVNTNIQFCLAQRDPNGNFTNGITRNVSALTNMGGPYYYSDDLNVKDLNRWNPRCYINIWLVNDIPGGVAGYAYLPAAHGSNVDGIVQEASYFGSSHRNDVVITHEMGHYLGLYHTFEGGCTNNNCLTDGDKICDTPPDNSTAYSNCGVAVNSCSTDMLSGFTIDANDLTEDYMDYSNFDCMNVFTQGQADRMNWTITNVRGSLLQCLSCQTPCNSPVTANFTSSTNTAPAGTNISFTNTSVNGALYQWYLNGAPVSTNTNYNFLFTVQGTYIVRLHVESANPALCLAADKYDTITINCPVAARFSPAYNGVVQQGQSVTFTNSSSNATGYQWYYDNAPVSTATNYTAGFNTLGTHFVKLKATGTFCSDSFEVYYIVGPTASGGGNLSFQKKYSIDNSDYFNYDALLTPHEELVLAGGNNGSNKNLVTKYTKTGEVIWCKRFEDNRFSRLQTVLHTLDNKYFFAGDRWVDDIGFIKTDTAGNVLLAANYSPSDINYIAHRFNDAIQLSDSSYVFATTVDYSITAKNILVFKVDKNGLLLWSKLIAANQCDAAQLFAAGNGIYICGNTTTQIGFTGTPAWDGLLVKLDPATGNKLFVAKYDAGNTPNRFTGITSLGNSLLLNGYTIDPANSLVYPTKTLTRVDFDGNILQQREIVMGNSRLMDAAMTIQNNFLYLATNDRATGKVFVVKLDTTLQSVLRKTYTHDNADVNITNLFFLSTGNLMMAGDRGHQFTLLVRTLPDLTTPGCNDSTFTLVSLPSSPLYANITATTNVTNESLGSYTPAWVPQTRPYLNFTICNYFPVTPNCDSVLIQNVYTTTNAGISGSNGSVISVAQRTNQHFLLGCQRDFTDAYIVETDKNGVKLNERKLVGIDFMNEVKITPDNGYVVLGSRNFGPEIYVLKFDAAGNNQWMKEYDIQGIGLRAGHILPTSDGGYFATCANYLLRLDAAGNLVYTKQFTSFSSGNIEAMVENGNQVLLGFEGGDGGLICLDKTTGNQLWNNNLKAKNIEKTNTGYFISGYWGNPVDAVVHKTDFNGNVSSQHRISIAGATFVNHKMVYDQSSGSLVFACGKENSNEFNNNTTYLLALDTTFQIISSAKSSPGFLTINSLDALCRNKKLYFAGNGFDNRTSLVNKYPAFFSFAIPELDNNCFFSASNAVVTPQPLITPVNINYNILTPVVTTSTLPFSQLGITTFTNRACAADECIVPVSCDTINCTGFTLSGPSKWCRIADTVKIKLTRGNGCTLAPQWGINTTVPYQITRQNDSTLHLLFAGTGTAKIVATGLLPCKVLSDSFSIALYNSPATLQLGSDLQLCSNSVTTLRAGSGFQSYQWQDNSTDSAFTAFLPGQYFVTVKDYCGNSFADTVNITTLPTPAFNIGNDTSLCRGDSLTLTAPSGFYEYRWAPNYAISSTTTPVVRVWPARDTVYSLTASYSPTCTVIDTIRISSKTAPPVFLGNDTSFCQGNSITLDAGSNFVTYLWNTGAATQTITAAGQGSYSIIATASNGCTAKDTLRVVTVYPLPTLNLGNDTSICINTTITFNAGSGHSSYLWQNGSLASTFTTNAVGLNWVEVTSNNGCVKRDSIRVISLLPVPSVFLGNDTTICKGTTVTLDAGAGFTRYVWQDGALSQTYAVTLPGQYWVEITNAAGCIGRDTFRLVAVADTPVNFIPGSIDICKGSAVFIKSLVPFNSYLWSTGSTADSIQINQLGSYWLQVTNNEGCVGKESFTLFDANCIKGIYFPNVFTPNNDGKNDRFKALVYEDLDYFELEVFNRYGQKIFTTNNYTVGWDGAFKGALQNQGAYVWHCTYKFRNRAGREKAKGTVLLLR